MKSGIGWHGLLFFVVEMVATFIDEDTFAFPPKLVAADLYQHDLDLSGLSDRYPYLCQWHR